jgi:hypothetical protein
MVPRGGVFNRLIDKWSQEVNVNGTFKSIDIAFKRKWYPEVKRAVSIQMILVLTYFDQCGYDYGKWEVITRQHHDLLLFNGIGHFVRLSSRLNQAYSSVPGGHTFAYIFKQLTGSALERFIGDDKYLRDLSNEMQLNQGNLIRECRSIMSRLSEALKGDIYYVKLEDCLTNTAGSDLGTCDTFFQMDENFNTTHVLFDSMGDPNTYISMGYSYLLGFGVVKSEEEPLGVPDHFSTKRKVYDSPNQTLYLEDTIMCGFYNITEFPIDLDLIERCAASALMGIDFMTVKEPLGMKTTYIDIDKSVGDRNANRRPGNKSQRANNPKPQPGNQQSSFTNFSQDFITSNVHSNWMTLLFESFDMGTRLKLIQSLVNCAANSISNRNKQGNSTYSMAAVSSSNALPQNRRTMRKVRSLNKKRTDT